MNRPKAGNGSVLIRLAAECRSEINHQISSNNKYALLLLMYIFIVNKISYMKY